MSGLAEALGALLNADPLCQGRVRPETLALLAELAGGEDPARLPERGDVLAYLERRAGNAAAVAKSAGAGSELAELANDRRRQLEIVIDEIKGGLHLGAAVVARELQHGAG